MRDKMGFNSSAKGSTQNTPRQKDDYQGMETGQDHDDDIDYKLTKS